VTEVFLNLTEVSLTLAEVFPCFFLSRKANSRVKLAKTGHGPHSMLFGCYLCSCVNVYCHRVTTQLQLINISYHISIPTLGLRGLFYDERYLNLYRCSIRSSYPNKKYLLQSLEQLWGPLSFVI
jgi:hypothetical protein